MENETIVTNKDGFKFVKFNTSHYGLNFSIENKNIDLSKVVDFSLIKLIYDLNRDIYEKVIFDTINDNEAVAMLLMKNFFEELGLPQRFSYIHMKKHTTDDKIIFKSQSIKSHRPENVPDDSELMAIQDMECIATIVNPHKVTFNYNIIFDEDTKILPFAEKMVGIILNKIFNRVKQFIEKI